MNTSSLIAAAALALFGAASVHAQQPEAPKTRAEVRAELAAAHARGELMPSLMSEADVRMPAVQGTRKSRAEVRSEAAKALAESGGPSRGQWTQG